MTKFEKKPNIEICNEKNHRRARLGGATRSVDADGTPRETQGQIQEDMLKLRVSMPPVEVFI